MPMLTGRRNQIRGRLIRKALSVALLFFSAVVLFEIPPPVLAQEHCTRSHCRDVCRRWGGQTCLWFIRYCDLNDCRCHIYCAEVVVV